MPNSFPEDDWDLEAPPEDAAEQRQEAAAVPPEQQQLPELADMELMPDASEADYIEQLLPAEVDEEDFG